MKKMNWKKVVERMEDANDIAICESRKKEKSIPFEKVFKELRKKGKL